MSNEMAEFHDSMSDLEQALRNGVKAYAEWHAKEWTMSKDEWVKSFAEPPPGGDDYFEAYNNGITATLDSVKVFLDECY